MKIVILDGTHNKEGKTLKLVNNFVTGVKSVIDSKNCKDNLKINTKKDIKKYAKSEQKNIKERVKTSKNKELEIKTFDLLNEDIEFCRGCNSCTTQDKFDADCQITDSCKKIKQEALKADILVFATPIYEYSISSVMKRFLERCLTLVTFRFGPAPKRKPIKGKYGVIICTSGAPFPINHLMGITWYPKFILRLACRLFRCDKIKSLYLGGDIKFEKAKKLGVKVGNSYYESCKK